MLYVSERPHIKAYAKDGSAWMLAWDHRADFEAAWTGGKAFWWGTFASGGACILRLADIVAVTVFDQAQIDLAATEEAEKKSRALLESEP